jgi:hypothetical protein
MWIADKTRGLRYKLIYLLSPAAYRSINIPNVPRPMIRFVRKVQGDTPLVGAEIGTAFGINAESILKILNIRKLYLVDPYEFYVQDEKPIEQFLNAKEEAMKRLEPFKDKLQWIFLKSDGAVSMIPDNLDFVYIDGNHEYSFVKSDIENYYPKVKAGGVIGGHDFRGNYFGLMCAVLTFCMNNNLKLHAQMPDWWLVK